jgi:hypothetical protein
MQSPDDAPDSRAQDLSRLVRGDAQLEAWAQRLQKQADAFLQNRRPDPLDGFLVTHLR